MGGRNGEVAMKFGARGQRSGRLVGGWGPTGGCIGVPRSWQHPEDSNLLEDGWGGRADVSAGAELRRCKRATYGWKKGEAAKEEFGNPALARRDGVRKIQAQVET